MGNKYTDPEVPCITKPCPFAKVLGKIPCYEKEFMGGMNKYNCPQNTYAVSESPNINGWAMGAAMGILDNLKDRRGIRHEINNCDAEVLNEMINTFSGIILSRHKTVEPLAVLADRKGTMLDAIGTQSSGNWFILINSKRFLEPTYAACELKARQHLETLKDKEDGR